MRPSLHNGTRVGRYRVVSHLGSGGMGEVYVAEDLSLERQVALKILPPEVLTSTSRLRRFVQEAKAASSLNHPHIVTIYEIGEATPILEGGEREVAGEPGVGSLHYIAMELVSGETLGHEIHRARTGLPTLLGYLSQAAEALARAHAGGIVHRDLKPENIMVSKDGYAKVLDFGLAKLVERPPSDDLATSASTESRVLTGEGVALGTVGYMSPEQVLGRSVDHRADIFSFGCILYEAATRRRPFAADTDIETLHQVLHEEPPEIEGFNSSAPEELQRLVRRCMAKDQERRVQSMKDVALELGKITAEWHRLSSRPSGGSKEAGASTLAFGRRAGLAAGATVGLAVVGISVAILLRGAPSERRSAERVIEPYQSATFRGLTDNGIILTAALSPDGRFLAYLQQEAARNGVGLRVKQIETEADREIALLPGHMQAYYADPVFSPDGSSIYYNVPEAQKPDFLTLNRLPVLGGTPTRLLFDVDSSVTFSPDGTRIAYLRGTGEEIALMVAAADGTEGRQLGAIHRPPGGSGNFPPSPSWSPDGERIVIAAPDDRSAQRVDLLSFPVRGSASSPIGDTRWLWINSVAWIPDGSGLVVAGSPEDAPGASQVWLEPYPHGPTRRITNSLNRYGNVSLSRDGRNLVTLQTSATHDCWRLTGIGGTAPGQKISVPGGTLGAGYRGWLMAGPAGSIVYTAWTGSFPQVWMVDQEGRRRQITSTRAWNVEPSFRPESSTFVFNSVGEDGVGHVWRVDLDGGNLFQLTNGSGETKLDLSPDGRSVLFTRREAPDELWTVAVAGGTPTRLVSIGTRNWQSIGYSRDGGLLAYSFLDQSAPQGTWGIRVLPVRGGGTPVRTLTQHADAEVYHWTPDARAIGYLRNVDGVGNVWSLGLDGSAPRQVTRLNEGLITDFLWSADGTRIVASRFVSDAWNLWSIPVGGGTPTRITDFREGLIFDFQWSEGEKEIVIDHGEFRRDITLITGFR